MAYWCRTCTYWNNTHPTAKHVSKADRPEANVVVDDSATVVSSEGSVSSTSGTTLATEPETNKNRVSFYGGVLNKMKTPKD